METYDYDEFVERNWMGHDDQIHLAIATLGLNGETGEVLDKILAAAVLNVTSSVLAEKVKKHLRGDEAHNPREHTDIVLRNLEVIKELGDVLFYLVWLAHHHGSSLDGVITANMAKLNKRMEDHGTLRGDGDNR